MEHIDVPLGAAYVVLTNYLQHLSITFTMVSVLNVLVRADIVRSYVIQFVLVSISPSH